MNITIEAPDSRGDIQFSPSELIDTFATVPGMSPKDLDSDTRAVLEEKLEDTENNPPRLITSFGGSEEIPSVVAPANIIPGLELLRRFNAARLPATYVVRSAGLYAVEANGFNPDKVAAHAAMTATMYVSFVETFYPDCANDFSVATEPTAVVDTLPEELLEVAGFSKPNPDAGKIVDPWTGKTIDQFELGMRRNPNLDLRKASKYMLSHVTIFEDVQYPDAASDFVIKVGGPSEMLFSVWQRQTMNAAIQNGMMGRFANNTSGASYNNISFFGPRYSSSPTYYKQANEEYDVLTTPPSTEGLGATLPASLSEEQRLTTLLPRAYVASTSNPDLQGRYKSFFGVLSGVGIRPSAYQEWLDQMRIDCLEFAI